jgi:hypothetical protein
MTRKEAEANWGWDPVKGSIPFKRPKLTAENIKAQQRLARPGTLIHYDRYTCERGLTKTDKTEITEGKTTITFSSIASCFENVSCLQCRRNVANRAQATRKTNKLLRKAR